MISVQRKLMSVNLRVHSMFLNAPQKVWDALVHFMKKPRKNHKEIIRDYINTYPLTCRPQKKRKVKLITKGSFFDLKEIFDEVNNEYFENNLSVLITYGRKIRKRKRVRYLRLGYYVYGKNLIYINRRLDAKYVPRLFVKFVIYHEMLHADMFNMGNEKRSVHHCREFKKRERLFNEYDEIQRMQERVIQKL